MGKIHSMESFGTVDGPGVRFVVFFEGCPMRCLYCHNPDTWHLEDGQEMSAEEILSRMERNRSFYRTGGITATGGEPMLQIDFLTELFAGAKERGIHTCLDTSGIMFPGCGGTSEEERERLKKVERLLSVTDLVMLDIKHMDAEEHRKLTGQDNEKILAFARYLDEKQIPVWIRHVVVPGITFQREELEALGRFLATLSNVEKVEILPYHTLGIYKWETLGIPYSLSDIRIPDENDLKRASQILLG